MMADNRGLSTIIPIILFYYCPYCPYCPKRWSSSPAAPSSL